MAPIDDVLRRLGEDPGFRAARHRRPRLRRGPRRGRRPARRARPRALPDAFPGDSTGLQGADPALIGVRRIEALVVLVPCDDPTGARRQVVRLTGAAYLSNLVGGALVTLQGIDAAGNGHQLTLTFGDRPQ